MLMRMSEAAHLFDALADLLSQGMDFASALFELSLQLSGSKIGLQFSDFARKIYTGNTICRAAQCCFGRLSPFRLLESLEENDTPVQYCRDCARRLRESRSLLRRMIKLLTYPIWVILLVHLVFIITLFILPEFNIRDMAVLRTMLLTDLCLCLLWWASFRCIVDLIRIHSPLSQSAVFSKLRIATLKRWHELVLFLESGPQNQINQALNPYNGVVPGPVLSQIRALRKKLLPGMYGQIPHDRVREGNLKFLNAHPGTEIVSALRENRGSGALKPVREIIERELQEQFGKLCGLLSVLSITAAGCFVFMLSMSLVNILQRRLSGLVL